MMLANPDDDNKNMPWWKIPSEKWRGDQHIPFEDRLAVNRLIDEVGKGFHRRTENRFEK